MQLLRVWWPQICFAYNCGPLIWSIVAFRNSLVRTTLDRTLEPRSLGRHSPHACKWGGPRGPASRHASVPASGQVGDSCTLPPCPLLLSVLTLQVYHSLDKMTSHFMHWFPAIVSWATRWHPPPPLAAALAASPALRQRWESSGPWELVVLPIFPYLLWAVCYYVKIFVISSDRIRERGCECPCAPPAPASCSLAGWGHLPSCGLDPPTCPPACHLSCPQPAPSLPPAWPPPA